QSASFSHARFASTAACTTARAPSVRCAQEPAAAAADVLPLPEDAVGCVEHPSVTAAENSATIVRRRIFEFIACSSFTGTSRWRCSGIPAGNFCSARIDEKCRALFCLPANCGWEKHRVRTRRFHWDFSVIRLLAECFARLPLTVLDGVS